MPIFPDFKNSRSMISIDNLCKTLTTIVGEGSENSVKVVLPQDDEYICNSQMVFNIAKENGKKIRLVKGFGPIIQVGMKFSGRFRKAFGSLIYER